MIASSSVGRPTAASRAADGTRLAGRLSTIDHCLAAIELDAVLRRDEACLRERRLDPPPPGRVVAKLPDGLPGRDRPRAEHGEPRCLLPEHAALAVRDHDLEAGHVERREHALERRPRPSSSDAAVIVAAVVLRCTTKPGSGENASTLPMLPAATTSTRGRADRVDVLQPVEER